MFHVNTVEPIEPLNLVTGTEAIGMLRIGRATFYRWIESGKVSPVGRVGHAMVFSRRDIEALAEPGGDGSAA